MLRPALFVTACLFAAFFGAVSAGVGYYLAAASQRLVNEGVAAVGVVTRLTSHQAGSGTSRTTVYRVFLQVNEPGGPLTLSDDIKGDAWRQLAEGDPLRVVYVPGDDRYCQVGDKAAVAATYDRAQLVTLLGGAVTTISLGAAAWVAATRYGRSALAVGLSLLQLQPTRPSAHV